MLKLIPDYLKTKTMCKNTVEKLSFVIICVPDQYKTQEMCEKVILDNGRMSTLYRMGFLRAACGWGGGVKAFPSLNSVTHPTLMKIGTVVLYLKKIKNVQIT